MDIREAADGGVDPVPEQSKIVVFGGTGFLGRRVVRHLAAHRFLVRVAARHLSRRDTATEFEFVRADVNKDSAVRAAVDGAFGVVNAVSLFLERGDRTFRAVHIDAAERVARLAREAGALRFVHVSGIGSDARSSSRYLRCRGRGEDVVRAAFPGATIVRPSVLFGPDDAFLSPLMNLLRIFRVFPMFGWGRTKFQPAYVEDVGEAIARIFERSQMETLQVETLYELGGPRTYRYDDLLHTLADHLDIRTALVPVPIEIWRALAVVAEILPEPPLTRSQVDLMASDNLVSESRPGFESLGIEPQGIETMLADRRLKAQVR